MPVHKQLIAESLYAPQEQSQAIAGPIDDYKALLLTPNLS